MLQALYIASGFGDYKLLEGSNHLSFNIFHLSFEAGSLTELGRVCLVTLQMTK
jgi:hypothetical protein